MTDQATPDNARLTDGLGIVQQRAIVGGQRMNSSEWQPIATAPRTGKIILFWSKEAGYFAGNWPAGCSAGEWHKIGGDWRGASHWRANAATHWTLLPKTPVSA